MPAVSDFEALTPDIMLEAVERVTGLRMAGIATPLPSYINRVYEIQDMDGQRLIAKFYRPGRWTREALEEEHAFVVDCAAAEIPVVAPILFPETGSLHETGGIFFAIFAKRLGRQLDVEADEAWTRVGRLLGRIHTTGATKPAPHRTRLHPTVSTVEHVEHLLTGSYMSQRMEKPFADVTDRIVEDISDLFEDIETIRIHGDCHKGNLLDRPGEGIAVIDFDDMAVGPPVQDLWMLLPDHAHQSRRELDLLLTGYEQFRTFDEASIRLIEPLRAMRIIYYLAWCSRQIGDLRFMATYPDWGSDGFWQREIAALTKQLRVIEDHLS